MKSKSIIIFKSLLALIAVFIFMPGCFNDLNTEPLDEDIATPTVVFKEPASYKRFLSKLYAGLAVTGQEGPAGKADIFGIDEGFGQYLRMWWYEQELSTDEAIILWNDQTIAKFHEQAWTSSDGFIYAFYSRIFYQVAACNEFLRQTTDEKLNERGVDAALKSEIQTFRAEARFLRALSYWHALDQFRNVPFVTEADPVGAFFPKQTNAKALFQYLESELKAIESELKAPLTNEYGRVDAAAAWTLLSRLYLNAEVHIGEKKYKEALTYAEKAIQSGYQLDPEYKNLFLADNYKSKEIIFPVVYDGVNTKTYGGTTFLIKAGIGGTMDYKTSGVNEGWGGLRTTKQLVEKFPADLTGVITSFNEGQTVTYRKMYVPGSHQGFDATDTDNSLSEKTKSSSIYEGHIYFPNPNTEIFFTTISSNTAPKIGDNGGDGTLETNGANIVVKDAGLNYLNVDNKTKKYTVTKSSWSIIGTATNNQEIPLAWDTKTKTMKALPDLASGSFVFKNNKGETFGDNNADGLLKLNGSPIVVTKTGGHEILLDVDKPDYTYQDKLTGYDRRPLFYTSGQTLEIEDPSSFSNGYAIVKFKNINSDGTAASRTDFPDTDFPMLRLAEVYLTASEAILRDNGDKNQAAKYYNVVRQRAYGGSTVGNVSADNLSLDNIIDERAREFYWEGQRRTDLVRFGQFTNGSYVWAWKGGVKEGAAVPAYFNVFPIPSADINANSSLKQNEGY